MTKKVVSMTAAMGWTTMTAGPRRAAPNILTANLGADDLAKLDDTSRVQRQAPDDR